MAELARLREAALKKNSFSAAVNAETNRGKAGGLYIERKIIKHGKLEDMSEEEKTPAPKAPQSTQST